MNNVFAIHSALVVNFGSTSAYASVLGYDDHGDVIVQLATPRADGSLAAVVPVASCALLPPKAPRRGYDRSLINTKKLLATFPNVDVTKNKSTDGAKVRVRTVDEQQRDGVLAALRSADYSVVTHRGGALEFTCSPPSNTETDSREDGELNECLSESYSRSA